MRFKNSHCSLLVDISIYTFRNSIKFHDPEITESLVLISEELSLFVCQGFNITQLEMQDESTLDNLKSTIHKDAKIDMVIIMHVRNGMSYLKLLLVPK